jgi:hypothetical protein
MDVARTLCFHHAMSCWPLAAPRTWGRAHELCLKRGKCDAVGELRAWLGEREK